MLLEALGNIKNKTLITSLVLMIVGLLMLIIPEQHDRALVILLGYALVLLGAVMVWNYIGGKKEFFNSILFTGALLIIVLGIYVLVSGDDILKVLSVLFGILLIIDGFHSLVYAWAYSRRSKRKGWWVLHILSALLIVAGIVILNNPWWTTAHSFVKVIGGTILFAAAAGIVRLFMVWPIRKA